MSAGAMLYVTVMVSPEIQVTSVSPAEIMRHHVEKAVRGIPERTYAVDNRVVRCVALPPWDLWDVQRGGSHMDPLAQNDIYSIRLVSRNLAGMQPEESRFAQARISNMPEGALLPDDYAAYFRDLPPRKGDRARTMLGMDKEKDR